MHALAITDLLSILTLGAALGFFGGLFGIGGGVPARFVWTQFCNSGRLSHGIGLTGFVG